MSGNFTINGATKYVESTQTLIANIDSFSTKIYYNYTLEALPLDFLIVNNTRVQSDPCTFPSLQSWLRCYKTDEIEFNLQRCVSNYRIDLSYGFNEFLPYSINPLYTPKTFIQNINLQCKTSLISHSVLNLI